MKALKGMIVSLLVVVACAVLLMSFNNNMQAAYGIETSTANRPYTWDDVEASLGINLSGKKLTELTLEDFSPAEQAQIAQYSEGKSIQTWIHEFCSVYGTADYEIMKDSLSTANPGKNFELMFFIWDSLGPLCDE